MGCTVLSSTAPYVARETAKLSSSIWNQAISPSAMVRMIAQAGEETPE
jgi:hypothetical protein